MSNTFSLKTAAKPGQIHLPWRQARDAPNSHTPPQNACNQNTCCIRSLLGALRRVVSVSRHFQSIVSAPVFFAGSSEANQLNYFGGADPPHLSTTLALLQGKMDRCNGVVFLQYSACANNIARPESAFNECPTSIFPLLQRTNLPLAWDWRSRLKIEHTLNFSHNA